MLLRDKELLEILIAGFSIRVLGAAPEFDAKGTGSRLIAGVAIRAGRVKFSPVSSAHKVFDLSFLFVIDC
jgi:hypothetical protein